MELSSRETSDTGTVSSLPVWLFWFDEPRFLQRVTVEGMSVSVAAWHHCAMWGMLWTVLLNLSSAYRKPSPLPTTPCARHERRFGPAWQVWLVVGCCGVPKRAIFRIDDHFDANDVEAADNLVSVF